MACISALAVACTLTPSPFPARVAALDEMSGVRCSVAPVGDLDGDGSPEFALARRGPGANGAGDTAPTPKAAVGPGVVWIFSARDGRMLRTIEPPERCRDFGVTLEDVGDLDGDGARDLAVAGGDSVWVLSGRSGAVVHELDDGLAVPDKHRAIAGGGDANGDHVPDVLVHRGSDWPHTPVAAALLYSGRTGALLGVYGTPEKCPLASHPSTVPYTRIAGESLRPPMAFVPDRDGDGRAEIALVVVEAHTGEGHGYVRIVSPGRAEELLEFVLPEHVHDGRGPWVLRSVPSAHGGGHDLLLSIESAYVFRFAADGTELHRHDYNGYYLNGEGTSLDVLGDVNGDGSCDYLIAANEDGWDCDPGFVSIHSGANGSGLGYLDFDYDESGMCGAGVDACAIGDANGDGVTDIVAHMPRLREARVLSGKDLAVITVLDLSSLEPVERR